MGGIGSGRWQHHERALRVDECQVLDLKDLKAQGLLTRLGRGDVGAFLTVGNAPNVQIVLLIGWTPWFGGRAWRMACPRCGRNCQKLYRPLRTVMDACPFGCRKCWSLAYRSSQEAHFWDRGTNRALVLGIAAQEGLHIQDVLQILTGHRQAWKAAGASYGFFGGSVGGYESLWRPPGWKSARLDPTSLKRR